jgi:hypothetical protein
MNNDSSLEVRGGSVSRNGNRSGTDGISSSQTIAGALRLDGVTLDGNGGDGLELLTEGTVEVFNSTITNNTDDGVKIRNTPFSVNLGNTRNAGNNTIADNGDFQLSDERPISSKVITAFGNTIGGTGAPPSGLKAGVASDGSSWRITTANNIINFGP